MRNLPDLQQFCLMKKIFLCNSLFLCFFVNFGVLMNYGGLRNDHSETPAHLSNDDSIISMVQQISCIAGAH